MNDECVFNVGTHFFLVPIIIIKYILLWVRAKCIHLDSGRLLKYLSFLSYSTIPSESAWSVACGVSSVQQTGFIDELSISITLIIIICLFVILYTCRYIYCKDESSVWNDDDNNSSSSNNNNKKTGKKENTWPLSSLFNRFILFVSLQFGSKVSIMISCNWIFDIWYLI